MTAAVTGVLRELVIAATPKSPPIIPSQADLDARLGNTRAAQRLALVGHIETVSALLDQLTKANGDYQLTPARIASLQRHDTDASVAGKWADPPVPDLDGKPYLRMDHKLGRFFGIDISAGSRIVAAYRSDEVNWSSPPTLAEARTQWLQLNALGAFCIRVMAAVKASKIAGVSLAEALALYRVEGDLVVPMPQPYLDQRVPPFEHGFEAFLDHWLAVKETMQHALWSWDKKDFVGKSPLVAAADRDEFTKLVALRDWLLIVGGLDFVILKMLAAPNFTKAIEEYTKFCHDLRAVHGVDTPMSDWEKAYRAQRDNFKLTEMSGRLVVAPVSVVLLVSEVLGHGLLLMKAIEKKGPADTLRTVPALKYLVYNSSDILVPKPGLVDHFNWIVASAAFALSKKAAAPSYCPAAYAKITGLKLPELVKGIAGRDTLPDINDKSTKVPDEHVAVMTKLNSVGFTATEREEFAQFILRATAAEWSTFKPNRANAARYARALAYYQFVAAP